MLLISELYHSRAQKSRHIKNAGRGEKDRYHLTGKNHTFLMTAND